MSWYRVNTLLELLAVAGEYPDGIASVGPRHLLHFHLQELVTSPKAFDKWKRYSATQGKKEVVCYISLFTDLKSVVRPNFDAQLLCAGCNLPMLEHPTGADMAAETPLLDRLSFALRAHVNAAKQGRTVSEDVKRIAIGALNEYEAGKAQDAEDADEVMRRIGADNG